MSRRRSVYKLPKLKLRQKTITALGSLVAFTLAVISTVAMSTNSQALAFWKDFLVRFFGWASICAPVIFFLSGLVLTRSKWKFAQTNVLLGFTLVVLSFVGLTASIKYDKSGSLGQLFWTELASFVTPLGAVALLVLLFLVGMVVLFNTSLGQILGIFVWIFTALRDKIFKPIFVRQRTFEAKHIPIKVSGVDERIPVKSTPSKAIEPIIADALVQNVAGQTKVWKYPPLSLLSDKVGSPAERGDVKKSASIIEKTLDSFGVQARVAEVNGGPAVTQYALEISAGTKPSIPRVASLNLVTNSPILIPAGPSAVPTGGAGVALPAVITNFIFFVIFFAIFFNFKIRNP